MAKPNYPSGLSRRVSGDWNCGRCNNLNFSFRFSCNKCHADKNQTDGQIFHSALFLDCAGLDSCRFETADAFGFLNERISARPLTERDLNMGPKIVKGDSVRHDQGQVERIMSQVKRPDSGRSGDWVCLSCNNLNFAFRRSCNKCRGKKQEYIAL